jgi:SAM-dependent methyltransferase
MSFVALNDEEWFARVSDEGHPLFPLPDQRVQIGTVGKSGGLALRDAFMFWQFCREALLKDGNGINSETQVADFGCAWGRIIRFWMKDLPPSSLHGFDVEDRFLSIAKTQVPGPHYALTQARPPLPVEDNSFDLIYAMSVFSHLPSDVADAWIGEFARVLKPGGIACLTTRPRAHIEVAGTAASTGFHADEWARVITNKADALARYDAGEFIFYPAYGGGGLSAETYGEAIIPPAYARSRWAELEFVRFAKNYSATYLQPCFVLRKR